VFIVDFAANLPPGTALMFMICNDRLPAPPHRRFWSDGEQREVIGACLRGAFEPEPDPGIAVLLAELGRATPKADAR
jgi:hypothetical protein